MYVLYRSKSRTPVAVICFFLNILNVLLNVHITLEAFPKENSRVGSLCSDAVTVSVYPLKISEGFELLKFPRNQLIEFACM